MAEAKILVVEDDALTALGIQNKLVGLGYSVSGIAATGEDALKMVEEHHPDLVMMDVKLQGKLDGVQTARLIHQQHNIPVIYLTAYSDEETLLRAQDTEPLGFLLKPINRNILNTTIQIGINLHEKICNTTEGKTGGLTSSQREELIGSLKPVLLLDEDNRIIWLNDAAEYLFERSGSDLLLEDGPSVIQMHDPASGECVDIFSLDPVFERPLIIKGVQHEKQIIPRIFMINDSFGDISGYYLELTPTGE